MSRESQYNAWVILALLGLRGVGAARVRGILNVMVANRLPVDEDLPNTLSDTSLLSPDHGIDFQRQLQNSEKQLRDLFSTGAEAVTIIDREYPKEIVARSPANAPPILFFKGSLHLLEAPSVGFCGARKASNRGLAVAEDIALQLVAAGVSTISGYAAGVDTAVHAATVESGGCTIVVLAEGIKHFRIKRTLKNRWDENKVLVISEFLPGLPWNARQAMQRNETICALSDAVVLVEAGSTGGSIAAGRTAISMGVPLFAPLYDGMPEWAEGNRIVLEEGAKPIGRDPATDRANVQKIFRAISTSGRRKGHAQQLSLLEYGPPQIGSRTQNRNVLTHNKEMLVTETPSRLESTPIRTEFSKNED
jgi:DNA processing protein